VRHRPIQLWYNACAMLMAGCLCIVAEQSVVEDSGDIDEAVAIIREIETRLGGIETAFTFRIVSDKVEVSPVQIDAVWRIDRGRFSSTETKQTRINGKPRESRRRQMWDGQRSWLVGEQSTVASVSWLAADSMSIGRGRTCRCWPAIPAGVRCVAFHLAACTWSTARPISTVPDRGWSTAWKFWLKPCIPRITHCRTVCSPQRRFRCINGPPGAVWISLRVHDSLCGGVGVM